MSHQNPPDAARVSRIFFYILMFAILGWFTYMQFFGADERRLNVNSDSMIYTGTFTWEKSDGTSEEITVPGRYDLPVGETMVLTTRLPEDYHENTMAIRSSLQSIRTCNLYCPFHLFYRSGNDPFQPGTRHDLSFQF